MAEANPGHYEAFRSYVDRGMFDNEPIGEYMKDIAGRAKYLVSPIRDDETVKAFMPGVAEALTSGLNVTDFGELRHLLVKRTLERGKVINLDELVCVEDNKSVVFVENDPEIAKSIKLTSFLGYTPEIPFDMVTYGTLGLVSSDPTSIGWRIFEMYGAIIKDDILNAVRREVLVVGADQFTTTANTVVEQLIYMEREGMFEGVRKIS
tara:strand:- start:704 stop:1324 length:621 start_codon:yes stop_codon:yes gene_type:complete